MKYSWPVQETQQQPFCVAFVVMRIMLNFTSQAVVYHKTRIKFFENRVNNTFELPMGKFFVGELLANEGG